MKYIIIGLLCVFLLNIENVRSEYSFDVFYRVLNAEYYMNADSTKYAIVKFKVYPPRNCDDISTGCIQEFAASTKVFKMDTLQNEFSLYQDIHAYGKWNKVKPYVAVHLATDSILVNDKVMYKRLSQNKDSFGYQDIWLSYDGKSIHLYLWDSKDNKMVIFYSFDNID